MSPGSYPYIFGRWRSLVLACLLSCVLPCTAAVADLDEADRAVRDGDTARALQLYEQVLQEDPDSLRALIQTARLLSWDGRLDESLERYERALEIDPGNRAAALGHAVVLSWDGRLRDSVDELRRLSERFPEDREIRMAHARTLAWRGDYTESREVYTRQLERDPGDIEAMVGTGRTYAWDGRLRRARVWYDRALALAGTDKDARVARGYLDLWTGRVGRASEQADALLELHPEDRDVREFRERVGEANAPWVRLRADQTDDTDENRLRTYQVNSAFRLPGGFRLGLTAARFDMDTPVADASIDNLTAHAEVHPTAGQSLRFHAGADFRRRSDGERENDAIGGLGWTWGLDRKWQARVDVAREPLRYSPTITDNGILFDAVTASGTGRVGDRWSVNLSAGTVDVSDGNGRTHALAGFMYRWPVTALRLETGYLGRWMDYDQDLNSGYFDPSGFTAHLARVRGSGTYGKREYTYGFGIDWGIQDFTLNGAEVDGDRVLVVEGRLGFPIGDALLFEIFGNRGDYAAQTAAGFESRQVGVALRWRGGP